MSERGWTTRRTATGASAQRRAVERISVPAIAVISLLLPRATAWHVARVAALLLVAMLVWSSPYLPGGLQWGDAALGMGRPDVAARQYARVARSTPFVSLARSALERSAMVQAVELGDPVRARRDLEWLARLTSDRVETAAIKERIGHLLLDERQALEASRLLREAYDACRHCPEAPQRMLRAAEILGAHGKPEAAHALYSDIASARPAWRARAQLGRAQLLLGQGRVVEALTLFEDASAHSFDGDLQSVAALGVATCLERLGNLDQALAELDEADLPAEARDMRRRGMRARSTL